MGETKSSRGRRKRVRFGEVTVIPFSLSLIDVVKKHTYPTNDLIVYVFTNKGMVGDTVDISRKTYAAAKLPHLTVAPDTFRNALLSKMDAAERKNLVNSSFSNDPAVRAGKLFWPCVMVQETYLRNHLSDSDVNTRRKEENVQFYRVYHDRPATGHRPSSRRSSGGVKNVPKSALKHSIIPRPGTPPKKRSTLSR